MKTEYFYVPDIPEQMTEKQAKSVGYKFCKKTKKKNDTNKKSGTC